MAYTEYDDYTDPNNNEKSQMMLSVGEVARMLGVHVNTVRRWSDSHRLPVYRIGPRSDRRFKTDDIDTFLEEARQAS